MYCSNCGSEITKDTTKCPKCGSAIKGNVTEIPAEYKPISMWGYFGYEILFSIPIIGFIIALVFGFCGGTTNVNLKNFARSYFCALIIALVIIVLFALLGVSLTSVINQ